MVIVAAHDLGWRAGGCCNNLPARLLSSHRALPLRQKSRLMLTFLKETVDTFREGAAEGTAESKQEAAEAAAVKEKSAMARSAGTAHRLAMTPEPERLQRRSGRRASSCRCAAQVAGCGLQGTARTRLH